MSQYTGTDEKNTDSTSIVANPPLPSADPFEQVSRPPVSAEFPETTLAPTVPTSGCLIRDYVATIPDDLKDLSRRVVEPVASALATTYGAKTLAAFAELKRREAAEIMHKDEGEYGRYGTATTRRLESTLASLQGAEMALVFPSSLSAIDKVIDTLIPNTPIQKAHFIVDTESYRRLHGRLDALVSRGWIELSVVAPSNFNQIETYLKPNTAAVLLESHSDPKICSITIRDVKRNLVASGSNAVLIVDNTTTEPLTGLPLKEGADLVVSSLTTYGGGDSQIFAGAVAGRDKKLVLRIRELRGQSAIARDDECLLIEKGLASSTARAEERGRAHTFVTGAPLERSNVHEIGTAITNRVERKLAALEGAESALVFPSGMAAIEKVIDALVPNTGEKAHFIVGTEGYRQTRNILERFVSRGWIDLTVIPMDHFDRVHEHIKPTTKAVFFETPSNPYLRVIDVAKVKAQVVNSGSNALVVVDHTFAGPLNQKPLQQGADLVVPSLTKYIGGNNTVLAGAIAGNADLIQRIRKLRGQAATTRDDECLRIERGIETLEPRTELSNLNGVHVANLLARNPHVKAVWYPGHPSHPDHAVALRQMKGFGGVVTFRIAANDFHEIAAFTDAFVAASPQGTFIAPSFGGELPLISPVPIVSHFSQTVDERRSRNIPDDLIRLSVGTVNPQVLTDALEAAFAALEARQALLN